MGHARAMQAVQPGMELAHITISKDDHQARKNARKDGLHHRRLVVHGLTAQRTYGLQALSQHPPFNPGGNQYQCQHGGHQEHDGSAQGPQAGGVAQRLLQPALGTICQQNAQCSDGQQDHGRYGVPPDGPGQCKQGPVPEVQRIADAAQQYQWTRIQRLRCGTPGAQTHQHPSTQHGRQHMRQHQRVLGGRHQGRQNDAGQGRQHKHGTGPGGDRQGPWPQGGQGAHKHLPDPVGHQVERTGRQIVMWMHGRQHSRRYEQCHEDGGPTTQLQQEGKDQGPYQVELFLHGERPQMPERFMPGVLREV